MPVNKDENGRRWIQVEAEVPGTPEEVWRAIATGPGISSWFVPFSVEEREGGKQIGHFGPDEAWDSYSTITSWDPPHRFTADSKDDLPDDGPTMATEWSVEAKSGDTCIVRVVHSLFTSKEDWDGQLVGTEMGWPSYFKNLRIVLANFRDQHATFVQVVVNTSESRDDAWAKITGGLGFPALEVGQQVLPKDAAPAFAGTVEEAPFPPYHLSTTLHVSQPAPGVGTITAYEFDKTMVFVRFWLFGDTAPTIGPEQEKVWKAWLEERLTPVAEPQPA